MMPFGVVRDGPWILARPILTAPSDAPSTEVGRGIALCAERSESLPPVELGAYDSDDVLRAAGVRSWAALDREFSFVQCERDGDGYALSAGPAVRRLAPGAGPAALGEAVAGLLGAGVPDVPARPAPRRRSFETLAGSGVRYLAPPDDLFDDAGDGGTDAYRAYLSSGGEGAWLAFHVDPGPGAAALLGRLLAWQAPARWAVPLRAAPAGASGALARGAGEVVRALSLPDGDGSLEVAAGVPDSLPAAEQARLWRALAETLRSVEVGPAAAGAR